MRRHDRPLKLERLETRSMLAVVTDWDTFADKPEAWPPGWETMEIEAKWQTNETILHNIKAYQDLENDEGLADGDEIDFGGSTTYTVNVPGGGRPRKFTDLYYDSPDSELQDARHVLRHRLRESSSNANFNDPVSTQMTRTWTRDWEKVQYKSTPARFEAIWFRTESGNAELTGSGDVHNATQQVLDTLEGDTLSVHSGDDPVAHAEADHPDLVWLDDSPTGDRIRADLKVIDFRYRVELFTGNEQVYELSLDKVRQCTKDTSGQFTICSDYFEAELEAIIDGGTDHTEEEITSLFAIVDWFESTFSLTPSTTSKGGVSVHQSGDYDGDNDLDIADIDLIWASIVESNYNNLPEEDFDLNRDGDIDADDGIFLVKKLMGLYIGDANLDGLFNSQDFVDVFQVGEYEDAIANNSKWAEGDWNFDGDFDSNDFVAAFADGGYQG